MKLTGECCKKPHHFWLPCLMFVVPDKIVTNWTKYLAAAQKRKTCEFLQRRKRGWKTPI